MLAIIYAMIACGVESATGSFWKATIWPYHVGVVIGKAVNAHKCALKS